MIWHSGDLIDVSNDIGIHISVKLKNQDKRFYALEISKDILEYQPIVFGGSNGIMERESQYLISTISWYK